MSDFSPKPLTSRLSSRLTGSIAVPGDKSISHRALMFGAIAEGETTIEGLLEGEDVLHTAEALRRLGATINRVGVGAWRVTGRPLGTLAEPAQVLDMGNSGTSARLLLGLLATHDLTAFMTGDHSLTKRPMARVTTPLEQFGARFMTRGGKLPLGVAGKPDAKGISYRLPIPSAQVKSAVLLAGLNAEGITEVIEPEATRDHSERMLQSFGADIRLGFTTDGAASIQLTGRPKLRAQNIMVPGDVSSSAFPIVAALITEGSQITVRGVGLNPRRDGIIRTLRDMGGKIDVLSERSQGGEQVADLVVTAGALTAVQVPADRAPSMIDEYPVLAVAAAYANGLTRMEGLAELRVKESDRLTRIFDGLTACGIRAEMGEDYLVVEGTGGAAPAGGGTVTTAFDHRIAMAFLVMGLGCQQPVTVDDATPIATSFPDFVTLMRGLGAVIE
jgi:3-phosphoshikimate 1-carboxyvinyltransferase